jgi:hypothetical protein
LPADALAEFVSALAHRVAGFPAAAQRMLKDRVNAITLAPADDLRRDSNLFLEAAGRPESQGRFSMAMARGFQTRDAELALARMVEDLAH